MAKKGKKGKKGNNNTVKAVDEEIPKKDSVDSVDVNVDSVDDSVNENEVNKTSIESNDNIEDIVENDDDDDDDNDEATNVENKVESKDDENIQEKIDAEEEANTNADKFVIIDSEDESDIDDNFTLKKSTNLKEETKQEISTLITEEKKDEKEAEKEETEKINSTKVDDQSEVTEEVENDIKEESVETLSQSKESIVNLNESEEPIGNSTIETSEIKPELISQQDYDPYQTEVKNIEESIEPVSIGQQAYDPYDHEEYNNKLDTIGQQAYDSYDNVDEEREERKEINTSFKQSEVSSFIKPTPRYKYVENEENKEKIKELTTNFVFGLAVVNFDHVKGPELTYWLDDEVMEAFSATNEQNEQNKEENEDIVNKLINKKVQHYSKIWPYLAFQALPDGVHMYDETFTQFTLCYDELKKSDVELSFDMIDLVDTTTTTTKPTTELSSPIKTEKDQSSNELLTKNDFENIDINNNDDTNNELEKVSTRPIITIEDPNQGVVTLFGCACIRQLNSSLLKKEEVKSKLKRSVIQKSVILLTRSPIPIQLREKLSIVTQSWFEQYDFTDCEILKSLYNNISNTYNKNGYIIEDDDLFEINNNENKLKSEEFNNEKKIIKESDFFMGLNFQQVVNKFRRNLLIIFKTILLGNYKILIFSKNLNELSNVQYCLIGLIPNLLLNFSDCGFPLIDLFLNEEKIKSKSLKSSDRMSILKFLGLPLRIFGFGSFFQPYLTLQQLSYITNINTKSFIVGSSNDIILEHKKNWFDMIVYLDEKESSIFGNGGCKIEILNKSLKDKINLTWDDKKFIDYVINSVETHYSKDEKEDVENEINNNDDEKIINNKEEINEGNEIEKVKFKTVNYNLSIDNGIYKGGDDFIRSQFEDYLIGFLSCCKYDSFLTKREKDNNLIKQIELDIYDNDINKFNYKWVEEFRNTQVFKYWNEITEDELFNFFEPKHMSKEVGKDKENNNKFNGGEVFKSWINKWNTGGVKKEETGENIEDKDKDKDKDNDKVLNDDTKEGEVKDEKLSESDSIDNNPTLPISTNNVKMTMNNFSRDVGQFFKKIGDNTSATFQQSMYKNNSDDGEGVKDKENEEDKDGATTEDVIGAEDVKTKKEEKPGTSEKGDDVGAEESKDQSPERAAGDAGFEGKLRQLFQWRK